MAQRLLPTLDLRKMSLRETANPRTDLVRQVQAEPSETRLRGDE